MYRNQTRKITTLSCVSVGIDHTNKALLSLVGRGRQLERMKAQQEKSVVSKMDDRENGIQIDCSCICIWQRIYSRDTVNIAIAQAKVNGNLTLWVLGQICRRIWFVVEDVQRITERVDR